MASAAVVQDGLNHFDGAIYDEQFIDWDRLYRGRRFVAVIVCCHNICFLFFSLDLRVGASTSSGLKTTGTI